MGGIIEGCRCRCCGQDLRARLSLERESFRWPKRQSPHFGIAHYRMAAPGWMARIRYLRRSLGSGQCGGMRGWCRQDYSRPRFFLLELRAKRQFERAIVIADMQSVIAFVAHQPDGNHQPVAADFGDKP
jgi:hypothetical protein